jgi:uncharacterized membrane protein
MPFNQNQQLHRRQNISDMESLVSVVAGSGLAFSGLRRQRSLALTLLGGALVYRGLTRHCPVYQAAGIHHAETQSKRSAVVTILRGTEEIYQFCSEMRNFPQFVSFLEDSQPDEGGLYRWTLRTPMGRRYEWKVEVYEQSEGRVLRWRSLEDAPLQVKGSLEFEPAPANRGTRVRATIEFRRGGGQGLLANLVKPFAKHKLSHDLSQLKQLMEAGEVMTVEGQPSGRANRQRSEALTEGGQRAERIQSHAAAPAAP